VQVFPEPGFCRGRVFVSDSPGKKDLSDIFSSRTRASAGGFDV
jgi:hypothetical protein